MRLFVGNLPFDASEEELRELFEQVGEVKSVKIVFDRESGRSKGFGFVEMASEEDGQNSIDQLNGANFKERSLVVDRAKESTRSSSRSYSSSRWN